MAGYPSVEGRPCGGGSGITLTMIEERRRRLEILDRQHAARMVEQDRRLDDALGGGRR